MVGLPFTLQWGHRLSAMEGEPPGSPCTGNGSASMGPSPFSDGRQMATESVTLQDVLQWGHRLSAMEGRRWCGETPPAFYSLQWGHRLSAMEGWIERPFLKAPSTLQWGHRLSAMEGGSRSTSSPSTSSLQWGHRLSAMEGARRRACPGRWCRCFNGAIAFQRWKGLGVGKGRLCRRELQWGHRLSAMEGGAALPGAGQVRGFNGAIAFQRWKVESR